MINTLMLRIISFNSLKFNLFYKLYTLYSQDDSCSLIDFSMNSDIMISRFMRTLVLVVYYYRLIYCNRCVLRFSYPMWFGWVDFQRVEVCRSYLLTFLLFMNNYLKYHVRDIAYRYASKP